MTSNNEEYFECYVYITLPGQTTPITAGRFALTTSRNQKPLGRFVYGKNYLKNPDAVEIDPVHLKLTTKTYETTGLGGIFGALRDAGPDYWGRRVIERNVKKAQLSEIDYLLESPDDRAGALGFGLNKVPPAPHRKFNQTIELEKLQRIANLLVCNEDKAPLESGIEQLEELMLIGTSMGGARPKVVVENEHGLWLAKFNRSDDRWNSARVEHSMLLLARNCGITTAESCIIQAGGRDILLVKRFDRAQDGNNYFRFRMISGLTMLQAEETHLSRDKWSYLTLVEELRRVSYSPQEDAKELFRRICFNALISNADDHPRNHALLALDKYWKLSPAYDLTPTTLISLERRDLAMEIGKFGRYANANNILSECHRFLLSLEEAKVIIIEMEEFIKNNWYGIARKAGVSETDCNMISGAFNYPGFRI